MNIGTSLQTKQIELIAENCRRLRGNLYTLWDREILTLQSSNGTNWMNFTQFHKHQVVDSGYQNWEIKRQIAAVSRRPIIKHRKEHQFRDLIKAWSCKKHRNPHEKNNLRTWMLYELEISMSVPKSQLQCLQSLKKGFFLTRFQVRVQSCYGSREGVQILGF